MRVSGWEFWCFSVAGKRWDPSAAECRIIAINKQRWRPDLPFLNCTEMCDMNRCPRTPRRAAAKLLLLLLLSDRLCRPRFIPQWTGDGNDLLLQSTGWNSMYICIECAMRRRCCCRCRWRQCARESEQTRPSKRSLWSRSAAGCGRRSFPWATARNPREWDEVAYWQPYFGVQRRVSSLLARTLSLDWRQLENTTSSPLFPFVGFIFILFVTSRPFPFVYS